MRILQAASCLLVAGAIAAACTINEFDPSKNPELATYKGGWGSGGSGAGGSTGTCDSTGCGTDRGKPCGTSAECQDGHCTDGVCCDTACEGLCEACNLNGAKGTCSPLSAGTPDEEVVGGKSCSAVEGGCGEERGRCRCDDGEKNGDETDVDCGGPTCGKCGTGSSCEGSDGASCVSGHCVDGYCCNEACAGQCMACNALDRPGLCSLVTPGTADSACGAGQVCNAVGQCAVADGAPCAVAANCASSVCESNACVECDNDATCGAGAACIDGTCVSKVFDGSPCQADAGCKNNHCVDGICCTTACDGTCMGCHINYTLQATGTCAPILPGYDPHDECLGVGAAAGCSGDLPDGNGASACGAP